MSFGQHREPGEEPSPVYVVLCRALLPTRHSQEGHRLHQIPSREINIPTGALVGGSGSLNLGILRNVKCPSKTKQYMSLRAASG